MLLTAIAGCTAATLAVIQLDVEDLRAPRPSWAMLLGAWLALAWAGVVLQVQGGTAVYSAVPVSAMTVPVFALIALAAVFGSGLLPWRGWASRLWARPSLRAAGITVATLQPLGLYLLVRAYELGDGRYPQSSLNLVLATWGVLVAFGAAARAQAAVTRREYMAEVLPGLAGFALMSLAVGSALGLVAALILVATAGVIAIALPLLPDRGGPPSLLVAAAAAGVPPSLAFGGRLLGLGAAFEAGGTMGVIGLAGVATWLLAAAAAARSVGLAAGHGRPATETFARTAAVLGGVAIAVGPALGLAFVAGAAAVSDVMSTQGLGLGNGVVSVATVSTVVPVVALLGPLLLVGGVALAFARPVPATARSDACPPLFELYGAATIARVTPSPMRVRRRERADVVLHVRRHHALLGFEQLDARAFGREQQTRQIGGHCAPQLALRFLDHKSALRAEPFDEFVGFENVERLTHSGARDRALVGQFLDRRDLLADRPLPGFDAPPEQRGELYVARDAAEAEINRN